MIKSLSFFSGAMGLDIGLKHAGIKTILACEVDKVCRSTIKKNLPEVSILEDILKYTAADIRKLASLSQTDEIDLITGGPPCQAFSTAGRRKGFEDVRGNVFLKFIELICELKPKYALIENVRGLLSAPLSHRPHDQRGAGFPPLTLDEQPGGALAHMLNILDQAGYGVSFNLYNSANFGSPQVRERVIIICARDGSKIPYLSPTHSENGSFGLPKWRTFKDAVKDLPESPKDFIPFPEKRLRFYRMLKAGQNWRDLPKEIQQEAMGKSYHCVGGKTGFFRRLSWDKPSPTLVTHPAMPATDLAHPVEDRPLSVQEYRRIQEFPDDWELCGNIVNQYRQLGNAVPCSLGLAAGLAIVSHINGKNLTHFSDFPYSRYNQNDDVSWKKAMAERMASCDQMAFEFAN